MARVKVSAFAIVGAGGTVHTIDGKVLLGLGDDLPLSDLADYARGSVIRGGAADWEAYDAKTDGSVLIGDGTDLVSTVNPTLTGTLTLPNAGLHLLDTDASHDLIIRPGSDLSIDRTLTLTTGDAARTVTLTGNPTLADWFDQSVKAAASPTFADVFVPDGGTFGIPGNELLTVNAAGTFAFSGIVRLDAFGAVVPYHSVNELLRLRDTRALALGTGAGIVFGGIYTAAGGTTAGGGIDIYKETAVSNEYGYALRLHTREDGQLITEKVRITGPGHVGFGTQTPEDYIGDLAVVLADTTAGGDTVLTVRSATDGYGGIYFADSNAGGARYDGAVRYDHNTRKMHCWAGGVGNIDQLVLDGATGRVGVGVAASLGKLHVDQSSASGAIPVMLWDQADLSEEFLELTTTVGAGNPIDTAAIGAYYGKMRVKVTGVAGYKYIALYN